MKDQGPGLGQGRYLSNLSGTTPLCESTRVLTTFTSGIIWLAQPFCVLWLLPSPHPPHTLENTASWVLTTNQMFWVRGENHSWLSWVSSGLWCKVATSCKNFPFHIMLLHKCERPQKVCPFLCVFFHSAFVSRELFFIVPDPAYRFLRVHTSVAFMTLGRM